MRDRARFSGKIFFLTKNWEKGPKMDQKQGFFNLLENLVINFYWIWSIVEIYIIYCVPAEIPYSLTRSLLVPYAYVSIKSVDCILLSSFELKAIWLISSLKTYLSLLNLGCVFNINLFFFMNSWWSILRLPVSISFLLDGSFYYQVELLLNSFYNFQI